MISNLGTSVEFNNKILGDFVVRNWICLDCGYKMSTNVPWEKHISRMPQKCPNCGTSAKSKRGE
jgi:rubrerythrin